jgi:hypothetical protein
VRLVSLLPSATEIVYSLGLGDDLVGVTFGRGLTYAAAGTPPREELAADSP